MAIKSKQVLKGYFGMGSYPDEDQFADLIDSVRLRSEVIPIADVTYGMHTLVCGITTVLDFDNGGNAIVELDQNTILDIQNMGVGQYASLVVQQDGTGGWALALPASVKVANAGGGAVVLSGTANAIDVLSFYKISDTVILCNVTQSYS